MSKVCSHSHFAERSIGRCKAARTTPSWAMQTAQTTESAPNAQAYTTGAKRWRNQTTPPPPRAFFRPPHSTFSLRNSHLLRHRRGQAAAGTRARAGVPPASTMPAATPEQHGGDSEQPWRGQPGLATAGGGRSAETEWLGLSGVGESLARLGDRRAKPEGRPVQWRGATSRAEPWTAAGSPATQPRPRPRLSPRLSTHQRRRGSSHA